MRRSVLWFALGCIPVTIGLWCSTDWGAAICVESFWPASANEYPAQLEIASRRSSIILTYRGPYATRQMIMGKDHPLFCGVHGPHTPEHTTFQVVPRRKSGLVLLGSERSALIPEYTSYGGFAQLVVPCWLILIFLAISSMYLQFPRRWLYRAMKKLSLFMGLLVVTYWVMSVCMLPAESRTFSAAFHKMPWPVHAFAWIVFSGGLMNHWLDSRMEGSLCTGLSVAQTRKP